MNTQSREFLTIVLVVCRYTYTKLLYILHALMHIMNHFLSLSIEILVFRYNSGWSALFLNVILALL